MENKTLWIMCGAPGSGKTWFAKNKLMKDSNWDYISRDEVRFSMIKDDEEYFSHENAVFNAFIGKITFALLYGNDNIIADATHLNWGSRHKLLKALEKYVSLEEVDVIPVVIYSDYKTIVARNEKRNGRACVPEDALREMFKAFSDPRRDPYEYTAIMRVDNS